VCAGVLFLLGLEGVEAGGDTGAGTVEQRTVVTLDHADARAHDPRHLE
jgi:hypothetical protein